MGEIFITKKIKKKKKQFLALLTLFIIEMILFIILINGGVKNKVIMELGNNEISLKDFLWKSSSNYELITNLEDIDLSSTGDTLIYIKRKNKTYESKLSIVDTTPPLILGVTDKMAYKGNSISYRDGVRVYDNSLEELELNVDSSRVNLRREGKYEVFYSAEDSSGNFTEKRAFITVSELEITEDVFDKIVEEVASMILKDSMSKREKANIIYNWTKKHVDYTGNSEKDDWKNEAYCGIKNGKGDCFTYFAVAKALLTHAGIENIDVIRVGGTSKHYWNLVNDGSGWYHFDATRHKDNRDSFMLTDDELEKLNRIRKDSYYNFDYSLYPRTP